MTTETYDVIVLGTGVAGLTAALAAVAEGATVGLFEKSDLLGGTSAMSGGIIWMPNNHLQPELGVEDSREAALAYLDALSLGYVDSDMAAAFVDNGPEMLRWVHDHTPCEFHLLPTYPDYHPEHPGGLPGGGRSVDNALMDYSELGDWAGRVRSVHDGRPMMLSETPLGGATTMPPAAVLQERMQSGQNGMGLGLVGALLKGCLQAGLEPRLGCKAESMVTSDGRVTGVAFSEDGREFTASASRGVIIATGGFEQNDELTKSFLRGPITAAAGSPENTGDGLVMAMEAGARLANMNNAWWVPVTQVPANGGSDGGDSGRQKVHLILLERTRPGSLMVNRSGRRFCNEAGNYNAMGGVFHQFDPAAFDYPNVPAWLIFDHAHQRRYDVASCRAGTPPPDWMPTSDTVDGLAGLLGLDPVALGETVDRFNAHAASGIDPDYSRGQSAYDTFNGDQSLPGIQATLGPLLEPPFHAIKIEPGTLGTNGGPKTDTRGRVLAQRGGVIPGLYAAGNAMAAPTGAAYGGAGGTIGPAMTFGWIAGRDAAQA